MEQRTVGRVPPGGRHYTLDGMRGVAAVMVAVYHFSHSLVPAGYVAVDLFFVMSGFVLSQAYDARFARGLGVSAFLEARFLRLYPLYILGTILGLAENLYTHELAPKQTIESVPSAFTMLPSPLLHGGHLYPFNQPSWSLFFELVINAVLAAGLFRLGKKPLVAVVIVAGALLIALNGKPYFLNLGFRWGGVQVFGGMARVFFSFVLGILLYRWRRTQGRTSSWLSVLPVLLTGVILLVGTPFSSTALRDLTLVVVVSPALVFVATTCEPPASLRRSFAFLGDISYPLYAVHLPTIILWKAAFDRLALPYSAQIGCYVGGLVLIAAVCEKAYDKPLRRRVAGWARVREDAPPQIL